MKFLGCFPLLLVGQLVFSQTMKRTIINENNNIGVPYATVKVLHKPIGTMTTANGEFELALEPTDTILITSIGYQRRTLIARDAGSTIYLSPLPKSLDTVVVRGTTPVRNIILGNGKDFVHKKMKCGDDCLPWGPADLKEEFAEKIIVDSAKAYRLKKVYIPTRKKEKYGPLLLRVYSEDEVTKLPGDELLFKYIEVDRSMIHKSKVVIDISADDLYISNSGSFYVSMGWPPGQGGRGTYSTHLTLFLWHKENTFARNLLSETYYWYQHGFGKRENGFVSSAYAVEMEERIYK